MSFQALLPSPARAWGGCTPPVLVMLCGVLKDAVASAWVRHPKSWVGEGRGEDHLQGAAWQGKKSHRL